MSLGHLSTDNRLLFGSNCFYKTLLSLKGNVSSYFTYPGTMSLWILSLHLKVLPMVECLLIYQIEVIYFLLLVIYSFVT